MLLIAAATEMRNNFVIFFPKPILMRYCTIVTGEPHDEAKGVRRRAADRGSTGKALPIPSTIVNADTDREALSRTVNEFNALKSPIRKGAGSVRTG
jgi:hypothetical protein